METRTLGRTGMKLSVIGFGGIVAAGKTQAEADKLVNFALDSGVTYFDAAPTYGDSEERLGPALRGRREAIFLACKTTERTRDGAQRELERSLRRLHTDHFDVYQLHGVTSMQEVETIFVPGGAIETIQRAKTEGKARLVGFSAHSEEAALALLERYQFDTVMFPVNWVCWSNTEFGARLVRAARERGMGILAIKAMARQKWPENSRRDEYPACWYQPEDDPPVASLGLRFAWSEGITACIPPGDAKMLRLAIQLADNTAPLSEDERAYLKRKAQSYVPIFPQ